MPTPFETYLAKILGQLASAKILRSRRGLKGGYELNRRPEDITLLDIIETLDGPVDIGETLSLPNYPEISCYQAVNETWHGVREAVKTYLRNTTLGDILQAGKDQARVLMDERRQTILALSNGQAQPVGTPTAGTPV